MFTLPILLTIAVGSAVSAAVSGWVSHRLGYDRGHQAGFTKAMGLDAAACAKPPGVCDDDIGPPGFFL